MRLLFLSAITSLLVALALALPSSAQHCGTVVRARGYQYQTYVAPVHHSYNYTAPVYTDQRYYYEVQDFYRDSALADAAAFRALKAAGLIGPQQQRQTEKSVEPVQPQQMAPIPQESRNNTQVNPALIAVVDAKCVKCHSGTNAKGGLVLSVQTLANMNSAQRWDMWDRCDTGNMPKGGQPISDAEVKLFRDHAKLASK